MKTNGDVQGMQGARTLLVNIQGPSSYPHLGCAYVLSALKSSGHDVDFLDLAFVEDTKQARKKLLDRLADDEYFLVGFSVNDSEKSINMAFDLAKKVKASFGQYVIFGGGLFGLSEICEEYISLPFVDFIASGEGELTLPLLARSLKRREGLAEVPELWMKTKDGGIIRPKAKSFITNLDSLPYLCYDDFDIQKYSPALPIMTSRGCPWAKCKFCNDICGAACCLTYRERSPENVFAELSHLKNKYPSIKIFPWHDQIICFNLTRFRNIITLLCRSNLDIYWAGGIYSMPSLTRDVFQDMYAAGCRLISFGVESGSQRILRAMNKGISVKTSERIIKDAHEAGLTVRTTLMVYYPGETRKDVEDTIAFLRKTIDYIDGAMIYDFGLRFGSYIQQHIEEYVSQGFFENVKRIPYTARYICKRRLKKEYVKSVQRLKEFVEEAGKNREPTLFGYNISYFESRNRFRSFLQKSAQLRRYVQSIIR